MKSLTAGSCFACLALIVTVFKVNHKAFNINNMFAESHIFHLTDCIGQLGWWNEKNSRSTRCVHLIYLETQHCSLEPDHQIGMFNSPAVKKYPEGVKYVQNLSQQLEPCQRVYILKPHLACEEPAGTAPYVFVNAIRSNVVINYLLTDFW